MVKDASTMKGYIQDKYRFYSDVLEGVRKTKEEMKNKPEWHNTNCKGAEHTHKDLIIRVIGQATENPHRLKAQ